MKALFHLFPPLHATAGVHKATPYTARFRTLKPSAYCTNSKANLAIFANFACPDIPGGDVSQPLARIRLAGGKECQNTRL